MLTKIFVQFLYSLIDWCYLIDAPKDKASKANRYFFIALQRDYFSYPCWDYRYSWDANTKEWYKNGLLPERRKQIKPTLVND